MDQDATRDRLDDQSVACPGRAELIAYHRGKLPAEQLEAVGRHLEQCGPCQAILCTLADQSDPLIGRLRTSRTQIEFSQEASCARLQQRAAALAGRLGGPPQRIGPYRLLRRLKGGGMGEVYEALHTRLDRRVALKTLRGDRMDNPDFLARFNREMTAVGKLNHPNIVRATDAGEADGWHFLVMDFVDGFDLATIVRNCGPLPIADAAAIAQQTALGLASVHEHGLVHRDIKPSNLMLATDGTVKILDLGLALLHEGRRPADELTETGFGLGTADYMSPEQAQDAHHVDIRADLYSLGCTLYKLLTGHAPFDSPPYRTMLKKMQAHLREAVPPVQTLRPETPAELASIVHRLLEKQPDRRYASPQEVAAAVGPLAAGSDLAGLLERARERERLRDSDRAAPPSPIAAPVPLSRVRPWHLIVGNAVFLVVYTALLAAVFRPWRHEPTVDERDPKHAPLRDAAPDIWPGEYPEALRRRPWGKKIELIGQGKLEPADKPNTFVTIPSDLPLKGQPDLRYLPLWCRRVAGTGSVTLGRTALQLSSNNGAPADEFTALALDDDPERRWFDFEVEMFPSQAGRDPARAGVFFGWRRLDDGGASAYFAELDDNAQAGPGTVHIGYVTNRAVGSGKAAKDDALMVLPADAVAAPIALAAAGPRYRIIVQARPHGVAVRVNEQSAVQIATRVDARGGAGIWVRRGTHSFGGATTRTVPP